MAAKTDDDFEERILDIDVSAEMESSYLEYAYSVIYSRALPDARDGLKPVQRRILYTAAQMGLRPDTAHVKCARVVGQVMGQLHPHGDAAIYDALVRLGQPWALRLPVIDGHGNFGSLDSSAAAMRYTECRMAKAAVAMTAGLDQDTVDFRPNYDGKDSEPVVLPAAFPNLLVNGTTGIAVGMATNIPPHNLIEVVQGLKHLIAHPDASAEDLMRYIPGPDLPTGGKIVGLDGIKEAYETGRGTFRMRANARIEQVSPRRKGIVITELPYMIGPEKIMEQLKALHQAKKISGISDVKDLTDLANGTRLVIEVKNGINAEALLEQLYKVTKLEDSFGINAVALVDGQPTTMPLKQMLEVYLSHRLEVTRRRSAYLLGKASDRLHLVDGLLIAIVDIDDVIAIIRTSDDVPTARLRMMEAFELTETQANYILDMQLRRLTKFSRIELEAEKEKLLETIAGYEAILSSDARLREVVCEELDEVARAHGTPRRTVLLASAGVAVTAVAQTPLEIPDDPCWVLLSSAGLLARTDSADPLPSSGPRAVHDVLVSAVRVTARGEYGALTSAGRVIRASVLDLPSVPITAQAVNLAGGSLASELIELESGERIVGLTTLRDDTFGWAFGTRNGVVKRTNPEIIGKNAWDLIRLGDGDEVVGAVELQHDLDEFVFITSDAQLLHFPVASVRPQGRSGGGMAGIKLAAGARVVFFGVTAANDAVVVTNAGSSSALPGTDAGTVKVTAFDLYPGKGRATGGVRCQRFLKGEDTLLLAWAGPEPAVAAASSGSPVDLPAKDPRRDASGAPGSQPIAAIGTRYHS
ncbi:MAG: DNA topoisomerase IV subunit A [Propionibacteriaceae bacterium]|jgi:DNA gyrase subunit A|nr:DNA topoisomerase IV subunit A [Propionibacteriaceae bacterium]